MADTLDDDDPVVPFVPNPRPVRDLHLDGGPSGRLWAGIAAVVALLLVGAATSAYYVDYLWFESIGYASVFSTGLAWRTGLWIAGLLVGVLVARFVVAEVRTVAAEGGARSIAVMISPFTRDVPILSGFVFRAIAWFVSIVVGLVVAAELSSAWLDIAVWLKAAPAGVMEPVFGRDVSFFLFTLPVLRTASTLATGLALFVAAATGVALLAAGTTPATASRRGTTLVSCAAAALAAAFALDAYVGRFEYALADHDLFSGVAFTDATVRVPAFSILAGALAVAAVALVVNAFGKRSWRFVVWIAAGAAILWLGGAVALPAAVYAFSVKPNELTREEPYLRNNIAATRAAFGLDRFDERTFEASQLSADDMAKGAETVKDIPLWDWRALYPTLKQIQQIRAYYDFPDVDIDRYTVDGRVRQVMLSPRELSLEQLPDTSKTWQNERLTYTHGYGVAMTTVNGFTAEGLPELILRDIPVVSSVSSVTVTRPEIYYGELTKEHVFVHSKQAELAEAPGPDGGPTAYSGPGIRVGGFLRRLAIAWHTGDLNEVLLSDYITSDSLLLWRREIRERVRTLAPFLVFDEDPYSVVRADGSIVWIVDGFTLSPDYPNSRHTEIEGRRASYARNSVKAVIDAYTGETTFYVFEPGDPLVQAYGRLFPNLFKARDAMPADVAAHVRYPELLIEQQAALYSLYHTVEPQEFYYRKDMWSVASEVRAKDGKSVTSPLNPYYVLMHLPGEPAGVEFVSILPFTPVERPNMTAWLAARSDGEHYGQAIVYRFPTTRLVTGPMQIDSRIDQDRTVSGQLSLWNQQGSVVIRGNLLVVPVGSGLLYVEPIFLQAQRSPMPELRLVALATEDRVVFGNTYEEALAALFPAHGDTAKQEGGAPAPGPPPPNGTEPPASRDALLASAREALADYERLTAEGKHAEAGQALDRLKRSLDQLNAP